MAKNKEKIYFGILIVLVLGLGSVIVSATSDIPNKSIIGSISPAEFLNLVDSNNNGVMIDASSDLVDGHIQIQDNVMAEAGIDYSYVSNSENDTEINSRELPGYIETGRIDHQFEGNEWDHQD